jgi:Putative MetA-pathway of phenol degradation
VRYPLALLALLGPPPLWAQELNESPAVRDGHRPRFELSSGVDFERGDFGTGSEIEKVAVPLTARVSVGRLRASAQLPWVRVTAPGNVIAPTGPLGLPILVDPSRPAEISTREGLGDLRVGLAYDLPGEGFAASVRAGVKLPTASRSEGLGTGEADYHAGIDVSTKLGAVVPFASVTYTRAGDPAGVDLKNALAGQAGAALRLGRSTSAHLGYSYAEAANDASHDDQRVFGGVNAGLGGGVSLGVYGSGGVSKGAADLGAGVSLGLSFD